MPYLARLEMTWLKSLRLHWDSVNYHWQRGFVGFNLERQRDFLRDIGLEGAPPWRLIVAARRAAFVWGIAVLGFSRLRRVARRRRSGAVARACRRLARAGLERRPGRRAARVRRPRRRALAGDAPR